LRTVNPEGTPGQGLQSFLRDGSFELVLSEPIIAEVLEGLHVSAGAEGRSVEDRPRSFALSPRPAY